MAVNYIHPHCFNGGNSTPHWRSFERSHGSGLPVAYGPAIRGRLLCMLPAMLALRCEEVSTVFGSGICLRCSHGFRELEAAKDQATLSW